MSVTITKVTISSVDDKRLVLSNAQWAATLSIGTDWDKIRVGCRISFDDLGSNPTGTPRQYIGMAASPSIGFANGPLSGASTGHFIGFRTADSAWTRNVGPPVDYALSGGNYGIKKVGITESEFGSGLDMRVAGAQATVRRIQIVQIEKGSPNFTVRWSANNNAATTDETETELREAMDISDFSAACTTISASPNSGTVATTESSDGFFNAIAVGWDRSAFKMYVSEMFFAKYE